MRKKIHEALFFIPVFLVSLLVQGQALPETGSLKRFVVFSSIGLITNTGNSYYTGDVGNNTGLVSGFGNFDGNIYQADAISQQAATDLAALASELNGLTCSQSMLTLTAANTGFVPGVYCVSMGATLSDSIMLDAQNDPDAVFVFNVTGNLSFISNTKIFLMNGAQSCRIFWNVSGLVNVGSGSVIHGNIIGSNPAINAITLNAGAELSGRVLATTGTITMNSVRAERPSGCGLPVQTGPVSPNLRTANCFALFSSTSNLSNTGTTNIQGKIGTDLGTVSGYQAANVSQGIFTQDASTAAARADIDQAYMYISSLPYEVDLPFPLSFGNGLTITPRVYRLNSATILSDTLFVNAQGNPNSVFIIKVNGNFTQAANAKVILQNGARSCNLFWLVTGQVELNANTEFAGTVIADNQFTINAGADIDGRIFSRAGNISTTNIAAAVPTACGGCPFDPVNNAPIASDDIAAMLEDANAVITNVLNNDLDPDGDPLTVSIIRPAIHGTSTTNGTNVSYKPAANYNGRDTIFYRICDNRTPALCDSAFIFIRVTPVNDRPVAVDDSATTNRNVPVSVPVLQNDSDADGDALSISLVSQPDSGLALVALNNIVYTPDAGFAGRDTFYYRICDAGTPALCDTAMVVINVSAIPVNLPPVANPDSDSVCANSDTNFFYVKRNDSDPNGDSITASIVIAPLQGTAFVMNGYAIVYKPQPGFAGRDTIVYQVCDSQYCDTSFVYILVQPAPFTDAGLDQAIAFGDSVQIGSDSTSGNSYRWTPADFLSNAFTAEPYASPTATTTYTLIQTSTSTGCSGTDEVIVTVNGDGFYNGLSPNNDGVNDYWKIPALNRYPNNRVTVINRYGSEVWQGTGYDNDQVKFTGTNLDGDALPDGTYYYVISYNNSRKEGWLIIKR